MKEAVGGGGGVDVGEAVKERIALWEGRGSSTTTKSSVNGNGINGNSVNGSGCSSNGSTYNQNQVNQHCNTPEQPNYQHDGTVSNSSNHHQTHDQLHNNTCQLQDDVIFINNINSNTNNINNNNNDGFIDNFNNSYDQNHSKYYTTQNSASSHASSEDQSIINGKDHVSYQNGFYNDLITKSTEQLNSKDIILSSISEFNKPKLIEIESKSEKLNLLSDEVSNGRHFSDTDELSEASTSEHIDDTSISEHIYDTSTSEHIYDTSTSEHIDDTSTSEHIYEASTSEHIEDASTSEHIEDTSDKSVLEEYDIHLNKHIITLSSCSKSQLASSQEDNTELETIRYSDSTVNGRTNNGDSNIGDSVEEKEDESKDASTFSNTKCDIESESNNAMTDVQSTFTPNHHNQDQQPGDNINSNVDMEITTEIPVTPEFHNHNTFENSNDKPTLVDGSTFTTTNHNNSLADVYSNLTKLNSNNIASDYLYRGTCLSSHQLPVRNNAVKKYWQKQTLKLEVELKDEKIGSLKRELDDLSFTGKVEEEVAALKKVKHDLELRVKDQEEELDDLAGQVQMLEAARVRLEMSIEQTRKENRRELNQRDEELEEVRIGAQKKVKGLEAQLENEHEERTQLVREKHELERRLVEALDRRVSSVDEDAHHRLKKELKKTKALLKDTQTMLEKAQSEGSSKLIVRQLKTHLEDAEFAKTAAIKARQSTDADLGDLQSRMDEISRNKKEVEDKCARIVKEKSEIQTQLEESEEEVAEVMKKYKATVSQLSVDQITLSEQSHYIAEIEHDKQLLEEKLSELSSKVEVLEGETASIHTQRRLEMKIKEVESKLELEQTTRQRLESQISRLKDQVDRLSNECDSARLKEAQAMDHSKKLNRQLREAREDLSNAQQRCTDASNKKQELEKQMELSEAEVITLKSDLKLAFKRIEDLQQALQGDISDSDSDLSDRDPYTDYHSPGYIYTIHESDSDTSLSSYLTASMRNQKSSSNSTLRTPPSEVAADRGESGLSPSSEVMSAISEDLDDLPRHHSPSAESFA